jgi:hypothetical protein
LIFQLKIQKELDQDHIKLNLVERLKHQKVFWSYDQASISGLPDEILIEKVLLYLDTDDIHRLFKLYPKKVIKKIWKEKMLVQEPLYHLLNRLYAFLYFDVKDPDRYIRDFVKKRYQSLQCKD